jgi:two-component system sensor histidine kinase DesK
LWTIFVLGWVVVLVGSGLALVEADLPGPRLALALIVLAGLIGLYLWLTLRHALGPSDLEPGGPTRSRVRNRLSILGMMTLLVITLVALSTGTEVWWLSQHVIVAAGLALPLGLAAWVIGAVTGLTVLGAWFITGDLDPILVMLLAFGAAAVAIRHLTISVAQLRVARDELARTAVDQERLRFARDLHDLLGHSLSLVILKSELAGRLLPAFPERAAGEIRDVEQAARGALQQVRTAVAGYRQPVLARELAAAAEMLTAANIAHVITDGSDGLPPEVDGLLAWAVREGVTNVIRHSRARHCEIRVARREDRVELTVVDDGQSGDGKAPAPAPAPGGGLTGLAERARAGGATVSARRRAEGGFELLVERRLNGTIAEKVE